MFCTMMWTLPVLVLGLVVHGIHVLGLVALVVRDLGLVVFVVLVLVGQLCDFCVHWHPVLITVLITVSD